MPPKQKSPVTKSKSKIQKLKQKVKDNKKKLAVATAAVAAATAVTIIASKPKRSIKEPVKKAAAPEDKYTREVKGCKKIFEKYNLKSRKAVKKWMREADKNSNDYKMVKQCESIWKNGIFKPRL